MNNPSVDVLIPVYKPGEEFRELLKMLCVQEYPIHEVLIANTEKTFWDTSFEKEYPNCKVIHLSKSEFDHGGTRRMLASESKADAILYMTQDAIPADTKLITELVNALQIKDVKAAYARQLPKKDCAFLECFTREFNYPAVSKIKGQDDLPDMGIKTFFCSNVCAMYDKAAYELLGGFPEKTIFNEDMIFGGKLIEAGMKIAYAAEAKVFHSHNYSNKEQFHRNFDLAVSQVQYPEVFAKYPSEGEGMRLVLATAKYACKKGKPWLVFPLIGKTASKYAGYSLGKRYEKLSAEKRKKYSMNPSYWDK